MPNQHLSRPGDESPKHLWSTPHIVGRSQELFSANLPPQNLKSTEYIPINKDGDRLDTYCPQPTPDALEEYHRQTKIAKICNSYHLSGECGDMSCQYDHSDVSNTIIDVLRHIVGQHPCTKGGACRSIKCCLGHLCQKPNCKAVKSWQCRFNLKGHTLDLEVARWVEPIETIDGDQFSSRSGSLGEGSSPSTTNFS